MKAMLTVLALAVLATYPAARADSATAPSPGTAKTYRNPLLPDWEIADPFVLRVEAKYYLYPTSRYAGHRSVCVRRPGALGAQGARYSATRAAATGRRRCSITGAATGSSTFTTRTTCPMASAGRCTSKSASPWQTTPWARSPTKACWRRHAIDADLFQDDDGSLYLSYVELAGGFKIIVQPMADPLTKKGDPTVVIRPTEEWEKRSGEVTEGPFMMKHNGLYYLTYSGTGANSPNYGIGYATSKSPTGPFVKYPGNPIVHRGGSVLGPGHHCVVEGPHGKLWLVYHQKWDAEQNFHRFLAIDPIWFDAQGVLHAKVSRGTDEPAP